MAAAKLRGGEQRPPASIVFDPAEKGTQAHGTSPNHRFFSNLLVKNTYRVLLTRGLKGCFVYFADKDTERFVRSRIESGASE